MKLVIRKMDNGVFEKRQIELRDQELIKKLLDLFLDSDVGDTEYFIYDEVEKYYQIDYYYKDGFKRINFDPEALPEHRLFLLSFV